MHELAHRGVDDVWLQRIELRHDVIPVAIRQAVGQYRRIRARQATRGLVVAGQGQHQTVARELEFVLAHRPLADRRVQRSEEHTSELQSLMRISYAVFCLKKKT